MVNDDGKRPGPVYSRGLERVLLDINLEQRWKRFKHVVGTDKFIKGVDIANVAKDTARKLCNDLGMAAPKGQTF